MFLQKEEKFRGRMIFKQVFWTTSLLVIKTSPPLGCNFRVAIKIPFRKNSKNRLDFLFFRRKSAPFAEFRVSRNSPFRGSEQKGMEGNGKEFRNNMFF